MAGRGLSDTHPKIEAMLVERMRDLPVHRKLAMMGDLHETMLVMARQGIARQYPDSSEDEKRYILAVRLLGDTLARKVYGHLVDGSKDAD
jgi:hypothetical protein